jgi:hypothetical protein
MLEKPKELEEAYEFCLLQANIDGAFDERLTWRMFQAAWDLCAAYVGLVWPAREIEERISINPIDGSFTLSHIPTSNVKLYSNFRLVAVLPPTLVRDCCDPHLCCFCALRAIYTVGEDLCEVPPRFLQAVARLFTYMIENRGDSELDDQVLSKCGAKAFLGPDLTYVL